MPWESHGGGYRKASDDDGRGKGFVRNVPQYEALRDKGMSKERAAAITNAHKKKRGPKRDDDGGASTILVKAYQPGTITQHQEQAKIHRRKARSGATVAARGAGVAAGSALLLPVAHSIHPAGGKAAVAGIAGGLAATAGGGGYAAYHSHLGNKQAEHAQLARRQRNAERDNGASTILAKRAPVRLRKAVERRDAAAAFLGGGAATQGASAVQQHRRANAQRAESSRLHEEAQDQLRVAENRLQRHTMTGKGSLPRRTVDLHSTGKILYTGRAQEHRAAATARNAITANRKAKGRAGMALGLAGAAAAVEHGRTRTPRYSSVGYR